MTPISDKRGANSNCSIYFTFPHLIEDVTKQLELKGFKWEQIETLPFLTYTQEEAALQTIPLYIGIGDTYVLTAPADSDDPGWVIKISQLEDDKRSKIEFIGNRCKKAEYALWIAFHTAKCTDLRQDHERAVKTDIFYNAR